MRPGPGSKRSPTPWLTSSSTRAFGIFTTNSAPGVIIAKILPFTFSAPEPNPCRDSRVTPPLPTTAATTGANRGSSAACSRLEDFAEDLAAFLRLFVMARRHCSAPRVGALLRAPNLHQTRHVLLRHVGFRRLGRVRDLLVESSEPQPSIAALAREAQISPSHFIHQFEALFGRTPHQFRIAARIDLAK